MKLLLDECLPLQLKRDFPDHDVQTVVGAGGSGKKNGELLQLMSGEFDVFVTMDRNLDYQQRLVSYPIAFVVFSAHNNKFETLLPLIPTVLETLTTIQPGQVVKVSAK